MSLKCKTSSARKSLRTFTSELFLFSFLLLISGCGGTPTDPIAEYRNALKNAPTVSIVLEDMKEEGSLFTDYFHKYRIVTPEKTSTSDWREVSKGFYERHQPLLGMTIYAKEDGQEKGGAGPPGYEYINNPKYGTWQTDSSGNSFWTYYGQYRLFSDLLGTHRVYRDDYNAYSSHQSQGRPYYGPNREFGTDGSVTKQSKPDFFARRMAKESSQRSSFDSKVSDKAGRTRVSSRGGSGSGGK